MIRLLAVIGLAAALTGCADIGSRYWGGDGGGTRWNGTYDDGYGGYRRDYGYENDDYRWSRSRRTNSGRTFRPDRDVVCDRETQTCYRDRKIDESETRDYFGKRAARRVDRVRDQAGTNRIFVPEDDVVCNRRQRACQEDGRYSREETREYFGKKSPRRAEGSIGSPN